MTQRVAFLVVTAALLVAPTWGAEEAPEDYGPKIRELQQEIMVIVLLKELKLERPVLRAVLSAAYRAHLVTETYQEKEAPLNVEFEKACREFREEDFANKGLSKKVEGRAAGLEHRLQALRKAYCESINGIEAEVDAFLSPAQKDVVRRFPKRFELRALARFFRGDHVRPDLPKPLRVEIARLRDVPEAEWKARKGGIVETWVSRSEKARSPFPTPELRERYASRLASLFEDVRGMSAVDFEGSGARILERLRPVGRIEEVSRELREIRKEKYGGVGRIGAILCALPTIRVLEKSLGLKPGEGRPKDLKLKGLKVETVDT